MLFDLLRLGSLDSDARLALLMKACARVFVIFCVLPIHEFAHALIAHKLGDDTARLKGRMTIAPMAHIDPIGALMIFLVGFGYAKPVPVNMRNFRRKKKGSENSNVYYMNAAPYDSGYAKRCMALVALAGPVSNLIMAMLSLLFMNVLEYFVTVTTLTSVFYYFFLYCAAVNVALALFNFLPIPPLDGSRILNVILPDGTYYKLMQYERYIMIGLLIVIFTGVLDTPLSVLQQVVLGGLNALVSLPFKLIKGV